MITLGDDHGFDGGAGVNLTFTDGNRIRTRGSRQEYAEEVQEGTVAPVEMFRKAGVNREVQKSKRLLESSPLNG